MRWWLFLSWTSGQCPYMREPRVTTASPSRNQQQQDYLQTLATVSWPAVRADIETFLTTPQDDVWPADYGNYGPLFVRLAWHNAGSYRTSDGRGGADGARQRFDPERSWDDNTNLDKARTLLYSVKKLWPQISWGDLITLTGTVAVEMMGGPWAGHCAGRLDDDDGSESVLLGPTPEQEEYAPCDPNGNCTTPLGSTTIGLIYLNPQGPMAQPDPVGSAAEVRDSFGRMNMNDTETVALIGGGHAFGKTHGACPAGPGPSPMEQPDNPWPGDCGTGQGVDTYTSGIEGPWTSKPTVWDVEYFENLLSYDWTSHKGPGDAWQWQTDGGPVAPSPDGNGSQATMMMTSDISLVHDPAYKAIVEGFAADIKSFDAAFAAAWYKLLTRDMGPITRCAQTSDLPPPQQFQNPLPPPPSPPISNWSAVATALDLNASNYAVVARLAWACASTFRETDYLGGCNGARVRFPPASAWQANAGLDAAYDVLQPVKTLFGDSLAWADLIVFAGGKALELASNGTVAFAFCPGRSDALDGSGDEFLAPVLVGDVNETADNFKEVATRTGLTNREYVALLGARRALGSAVAPFSGPWTLDPTVLDNAYFASLIDESWQLYQLPDSNASQYKTKSGTPIFAQSTDINVKYDAELAAIAQDYALDNAKFLADLAPAWTKLMNADRFDTPSCLP